MQAVLLKDFARAMIFLAVLLWAIGKLTAAGLAFMTAFLLLDVITKRIRILAELKGCSVLPK
ncbi:hypothetical protein KHQ08_15950 [Pseudochrobactrum algeriensis]|uniref:hypothetical protein n=1 Tax=Pseudochrobactrum algeriensis TaxID=2834768 RepID=UPI001BCF553E|nr:hypothetical protein [Pseudochrobactrum algeriensis]QVQ36579.1 hypothetical protein KHQ08_15950 [Pseudochrobactrum algeriensis]QVQ39795.1 hypothetical protein KHQ07_14215 [Pseudochrobactrum algeriensis]QVQ43716.1 hypothetical protein KHQ09_16175 [Pseudochrobactrum algeriensis]